MEDWDEFCEAVEVTEVESGKVLILSLAAEVAESGLFPLTEAAVDVEEVNCTCSCRRSAANLSLSLLCFWW